nr:hypothetical protein HK105_001334 [Polyrhizophydium stewartii]
MRLALQAYCCLQFVTRKHWRSLIKLKPVFVGRVDKTGAYDPANEPFTLNIFNTTGPAGKSSRKTFPSKQAKTWPEEVPTMRQRKIQRRRSLEALALQTLTPVIRSSQHAALSSVSASASASTPDLFGTVPRRRRALSGPHTDVTALANVMQMLDSAQMTRRGMSPAPPATTPATSAPPSPRHATSASAAVAAAAAAGEAGARGGSSMTLNSVGGTTAASTVRSSVGNQTGRSMPTPPLDSSVMSGSTRAGNGSFVAMQEDPKISFPPPLQPRPQPQPQQQQQQQVQQPQQPQPPALHVPPAAEPVTAPGPEDGQGGPSQASASDGPEIWTRTPEGHIEMASRFIKFAIGAYGSSFLKIMGLGKARDHLPELDGDHYNHQSLAFHANIPVEHIVSSSFVTPSTLEPPTLIAPVHYVVVDRQSKSVVVSLRGTLGISDIVTDLMASYVRYKTADNLEGFVHSGMFKSAQKIATGPVREAVAESLRRHPGYALILTGHSLGGGCAALLAMMWARRITTVDGQEGFVLDERAGLPRRPIHCYVFVSSIALVCV